MHIISIKWIKTGSRLTYGDSLPNDVVRYNEFTNNLHNFPNRNNIRFVLVSVNQQEALGLNGLTELAFGETNVSDEDIFDFFCNGTNNYTYYLTLNRTDSLTVIFYDLLEPLPIDPVASTLKVISKLNKDYDR